MDNNSYNMPGAGESLNERLQRAADMARRHMNEQPAAPTPHPAPRPTAPAAQPMRGGEASRLPQQPAPQPAPRPTAPAAQPMRGGEASRLPQQPTAPAAQPMRGGEASRLPQQPAPPRQQPPVAPPRPPKEPKSSKTGLLIGIIAAVVVIAGVIIFLLFNQNRQREAEQQQQIEQLQLEKDQMELANEYNALNNEFAQYENQTSMLANDSIVQKYAAARSQVEKLLEELKNEKNKSAAQIAKLKGEIETLKAILRTYVEQINELQKENQSLRTENEAVRAENTQLNQTVQNVQATNQHLNERMTLAEKLNVTGVSLVALNKKGKTEKNVTKARQLMVSFTIPQNNSTPVGEKTIYCRIVSPEGELLGNAGTFSFEGSSLQATAKKSIEYQGEEIGGIKIYWDVSATLNPGDYTVELFADNYRLASRRFTLSK